ncbi:hypothetical protein [Polyangium aurulentum]|uniref:hypothetical protein n=1 Tax=Polyangium aurulentum TaxID=2567896 RepID=UPI00146F6C54|nr:hypothetical protein [Polyangium aurulentum]UQA60392.1 hypothetical protein E8A73_007935 [Polyangium aurulentum]
MTSSGEEGSGITARIEPTEQAAAALAKRGLRLSDAILDVVSELLAEIARDGEGEP